MSGAYSGEFAPLVSELATTLGEDRARTVVDDALRARRSRTPGACSQDDLLDEIQAMGGVPALAARAVLRAAQRRPSDRPSAPEAVLSYMSSDVERMLARSLGDDQARKVVRAAWAQLALPPAASREQALSLLDTLAKQSGIVGVTARFAKARLILD